MLIASIKSDKYPSVNRLIDIPFIGGFTIVCITMLPMLAVNDLVQEIFGRNKLFDLSVSFFLNTLFFHLFLLIAFDIRIKLFFIPTTLFCLFCVFLNDYRQWDSIILILNS